MSGNAESELPAAGRWPELAVKNFGPIAEGKVEIRPLTVFAGSSNTGKSWLATLIYAMMRHGNAGYGFRGFRSHRRIDLGDNGLDDLPEDPAAWLQSLQEGGSLRLTDGELQALKSFLESGQEALEEEVLRCFGLADVRDLVREGDVGAASITFMNNTAPESFATHRHLTIGGDGDVSLRVDIVTDECRPASENFLDMPKQALEDIVEDLQDDEWGKRRSRILRANLMRFLVGHHRFSSTHYLPADRGGVMHAHRVVVGALIQSASRAGLTHRSPLPTLSGVLGDFLEQLIEVAGHRPADISRRDRFAGPAGSLEQNVLKGKIRVQKSEVDYPYFTYRPDSWKRDLSLMSVSSMVSELAPVALYLRHCVRRGDLLILEEPEAHLHPEMQVLLVHEIAGWVRRGIRVLITTHSEWVLEAIANMVAGAEAGKADGLPQQDVGIWRFEKSARSKMKGSRVREVEWDPDEGGFPVGFGKVAGDLTNAWADLLEKTE